MVASTVTAGSAAAADQAPAATSATSARIHCQLTIGDPHLVAGTVTVTGKITCSSPVASQRIAVDLYKNGALVQHGTPVSTSGTAVVEGSAATACSSDPADRYYGRAYADVTYPPGFTPPTWSANNRSYTFNGLSC